MTQRTLCGYVSMMIRHVDTRVVCERTVKQMLVLVVIVKITTVLLDLVDAELRRVNLLGTQAEVVQLAANLAATLSIGTFNPERLHIGAVHDVIPLAVGDP